MQRTGHWPFSDPEHGPEAARGKAGNGNAQARRAAQAAARTQMRHDRLIVGGRAHTKKAGLS